MKFKLILAAISVMALPSCSKTYDYSGSFEATKGEGCEVLDGDNEIITIFPSADGASSYTARLNSNMSGGGVFPLESKPSNVSEDGSITFMFFKEGKPGLFSGQPGVDMKIKIKPKDSDHLYLESWPVAFSSPSNSSFNGSFDFVKDSELSMMGTTAPNELSRYAGKSGLCLKKIEI